MPNNSARRGALAAQVRLRPLVGRQLVLISIVALVLWALRERIPAIDFTRIWVAIHLVTWPQWALALIATLASFWAVGRYDQVLHGLLGTGVQPIRARRSGRAAIAIAQFAGFGVLSGALVRWRLLPEVSLATALKVSLAVSLSFLAGWAVISAALLLAIAPPGPAARGPAIAVLLTACALAGLLLFSPRLSERIMPLRAALTLTALVLIDTAFASAAFYALLPADPALAPPRIITAFLLALGAGLIGGTPGGIGPFELTLLTLLPEIPADQLLATALVFRLVYYVLPAALALAALIRGAPKAPTASAPTLLPPAAGPYLAPALESRLWYGPRSEVNLLRQGDFGVLEHNGSFLGIAAPVAGSLVLLNDPFPRARQALADSFRALAACAAGHQRSPMIYKCTARSAAHARRAGWRVLAVAQEAWLHPGSFSTTGSQYRQLRRQLRKAEQSGIRVREGTRDLPLDDMAEIARDWARSHGGERGFSMGRFGRDYVNCQRVFLAYKDGELTAFISFHENRNEWTLDLMRARAHTPDGTMHLLVVSAIDSARAASCPRLSLAALPLPPTSGTTWPDRIRRTIATRSGGEGLRRFKSSFAPNLQTLYATAPGWLALFLGLIQLFRRINRGVRRRAAAASRSL